MRILITGSSGFIGKKLVSELVHAGHIIGIVARGIHKEYDSSLHIFFIESQTFDHDIVGFSPEVVFHTAGLSIYPNSKEDENLLWEANLFFGIKLLNSLKNCTLRLFINFNTSLAYEGSYIKPSSYYALTKSCFYNSLLYFVNSTNTPVFNLILYSVYGVGDPNKRALNYVIDSIDSSSAVRMSPGLQELDFVHVNDVVELCVKLLYELPVNNLEDIHVGTGISTNLIELKDLVQKIAVKKCKIEFGSIPYRKDEKMINVAPNTTNRFWHTTIRLEEGIAEFFN